MKILIITSTIFFTFLLNPFSSVENINTTITETHLQEISNDRCTKITLLINWAPGTSESRKKQVRQRYYKYGLYPHSFLTINNGEYWSIDTKNATNTQINPFNPCDRPEGTVTTILVEENDIEPLDGGIQGVKIISKH